MTDDPFARLAHGAATLDDLVEGYALAIRHGRAGAGRQAAKRRGVYVKAARKQWRTKRRKQRDERARTDAQRRAGRDWRNKRGLLQWQRTAAAMDGERTMGQREIVERMTERGIASEQDALGVVRSGLRHMAKVGEVVSERVPRRTRYGSRDYDCVYRPARRAVEWAAFGAMLD